MPWKIVKSGSEYLVVKKDSGEVKSRFKTRARAVSYLRALYANVKERF